MPHLPELCSAMAMNSIFKYLWCFVNTLMLFKTQHGFHQVHLGFSYTSSKPSLETAPSCTVIVTVRQYPKELGQQQKSQFAGKKKKKKQKHFANQPALELVLSFSLTPNSMKTLTFYLLLFLTPRTGSHEKLLICFDHINSNLNLFFFLENHSTIDLS